MKGYKAFNKDLQCRGMQFEIGQTYEIDGYIKPCERGYHFCKSIAECFNFYPMSEDTRICEVTALGNVKTDDEVKYCTDKIKIGREIKKPREKSNTSLSSSGYCAQKRIRLSEYSTKIVIGLLKIGNVQMLKKLWINVLIRTLALSRRRACLTRKKINTRNIKQSAVTSK